MTAMRGAPQDLRVQIAFGAGPKAPSQLAALPASAWTDVAPWVREMRVQYGRDGWLGSQPQAGQLRLRLNNRDGRFTIFNAASPIAGIAYAPRSPVRVTAKWNGIWYPVFFGHVEEWPPAMATGADAGVELDVSATCPLRYLLGVTMLDTWLAQEIDADGPATWFQLDDTSGDVLTDTATDYHAAWAGQRWLGVASTTGPSPDVAINRTQQSVVLSRQAAVGIGTTAWTLEFVINLRDEPAQYALPLWAQGAYTNGLVVFLDPGRRLNVKAPTTGAAAPRTTLADATVPAGTEAHIAVRRSGSTITAYLNGAPVASWAPPGGSAWAALPWVAPHLTDITTAGRPEGWQQFQGSIAHVATHNRALSNARILAHGQATVRAPKRCDEWAAKALTVAGWPTTDRVLEKSVSTVNGQDPGRGSALGFVQRMADAETGLVYARPDGKVAFRSRRHLYDNDLPTTMPTFGNTAVGELVYEAVELALDLRDLATEVVVTRQGGTPVTLQADAATVARWGRTTPFRIPGKDISRTEYEIRDALRWFLDRFQNPEVRVNAITVRPGDQPAQLWPVLLGLALWQPIRVRYQDRSGAAPFDTVSMVERIEHTYRPGSWETVVGLAPGPKRTAARYGTGKPSTRYGTAIYAY
jgi:hypothetical protein